jgi:hypothetical protein
VLKAFTVSNGTLSPAAVASGSAVYQFPGATPAVSSYGNSANGIVWETQYSTTNAVLRAYNTVPSGSSLPILYSSGTAMGAGVKFTVPTVADGRVYVGTSGTLTVFGLLSNPTTAPNAPTGLTATAGSVQGLQVQLSWTDASSNENAFKIERSTDNLNFIENGVASVNATSYTDKSVEAGKTYYYRVRSTNPVGDSLYTSVAQATTISPTPIDLYQFDEGTGNFAADSAGMNTGVLVGATKPAWVSGRIGSGALSFNGNGAYNQTNQSAVQVSSNFIAPLGTTSTLAAWVKTTQTGSNNHSQAPAITGVDQLGTTSDINWGTLNASGQIGVYVGDSGGLYSASPINDGQWHHVAMTRDAATGQVQLYIDGILNGSSALDAGTKAAQFYLIGALTNRTNAGYVTGANYFNGQLDEVRVYNRVLSATEILALGQPPSAPSGLTANTIPDTGSMLQLSWTNNSNISQGVQVERRTGNGAYAQIATVPGTETGFIDTDLEAGIEYHYRVQAIGSGGSSDYSNEATSAPLVAQVVGRFVFYNASSFDFQNGSSSFLDGFALATDKQALLPGQTATFQNYTSYSKGINGIMIDVANFEGSITPDDYSVIVGNSSDINSWQPAPTPTFITQYLGAGVNGSVRLELVWDDNTIQNEWVQVTLKATENTGLAVDDVFYFGNSIGDIGNSPTDALVDTVDILGVQVNHTSTASVTNIYDFNRDKVVDEADDLIVRANYSGAAPMVLITAPGDVHGAGAGLAAENNLPLAQSAAGGVGIEPFSAASSDHKKSVDTVFAGYQVRSTHADLTASLLNLESVWHGSARHAPNDADRAQSPPAEAMCNGSTQTTDGLIAREFERLWAGRFKPSFRRYR